MLDLELQISKGGLNAGAIRTFREMKQREVVDACHDSTYARGDPDVTRSTARPAKFGMTSQVMESALGRHHLAGVRSYIQLFGVVLWGLLGLGCSDTDPASEGSGSSGTMEATDADTDPEPLAEGPATVEFRGLDIAYEAYGAGEPAIVFVHGGISTGAVWDLARESQQAERRVVVVDLPGHGASDPAEAYDAALFEGAVRAAMDAAGVERAVMVGHSFGVSVSRDVALAAPQRVVGMLMLDGFVVPLGGDPAVGQALIEPFRGAEWRDAARSFIEEFMIAANTPATVADEVRDMMLGGSQAVWLGVLEIAIDPGIERDTEIDVPVYATFLPGPALPDGYEDYLRARFPDLEFDLEPPGNGHFIMLERPAEFAVALDDLMERVER